MRQACGYAIVFASVVTGVSACDSAQDQGGGSYDSGSAGSGGTSGGAGGAAGAPAVLDGSAGASEAGTDSGGAPNCTSLADPAAQNPTPGTCENGAAVTCDETGHLVTQACSSGLSCQTYPLLEWRLENDLTWTEGRKVVWAGCVPAETCTLHKESGGSYLADTPPHCEGTDRVVCQLPPNPGYLPGPPGMEYGSETGYVWRDTCAVGQKCAGTNTSGVLTCIPETTPACDGSEPFCDPGGAGTTHCYGTWESMPGYRAVEPCPSGDVCYEGNSAPHCDAPGEVACTAATLPRQCTPDKSMIVDCNDGITTHFSCATCSVAGNQVPCRCDEVNESSPFSTCNWSTKIDCVPKSKPDCDRAVDADSCAGDVAQRCVGFWEKTDCAVFGQKCLVAGGIAGCVAPGAVSCTNLLGLNCSGDALVGCCSCTGGAPWLSSFVPSTPPCTPGYEIHADCTQLGFSYHCEENVSGAECEF